MDKINRSNEIMDLFRSINGRFRMLKRDRFKDLNLTGTQGMMLGIIAHHGPIKISDLSRHMNLSVSAASEMVSRLEKMGLASRRRDENDKRIVLVELNEIYKKKSMSHCACFEKFANGLFETATHDEIETIYEGLKTLDKLFESKIDISEEESQDE